MFSLFSTWIYSYLSADFEVLTTLAKSTKAEWLQNTTCVLLPFKSDTVIIMHKEKHIFTCQYSWGVAILQYFINLWIVDTDKRIKIQFFREQKIVKNLRLLCTNLENPRTL